VVDLSRLRDIGSGDAPATIYPDAVYNGISNAHDIAINEDTGFAYAVGNTRPVTATSPCHGGGLHMVDIRDPDSPDVEDAVTIVDVSDKSNPCSSARCSRASRTCTATRAG